MDEEMVEQETLDTASGEDTLDPQASEDVVNEQENEAIRKANELANNYKIRAEKAERMLKQKSVEAKSADKVSKEGDIALSPKDYLALTEHKVSSEDFDEVVRLSKVLGKSIAETMKDKVAKTILEQRAEERATALAANTSTARRGAKTESANDILEKFNRGIVPDKEEDIEKLVRAEIEHKKAQLKR